MPDPNDKDNDELKGIAEGAGPAGGIPDAPAIPDAPPIGVPGAPPVGADAPEEDESARLFRARKNAKKNIIDDLINLEKEILKKHSIAVRAGVEPDIRAVNAGKSKEDIEKMIQLEVETRINGDAKTKALIKKEIREKVKDMPFTENLEKKVKKIELEGENENLRIVVGDEEIKNIFEGLEIRKSTFAELQKKYHRLDDFLQGQEKLLKEMKEKKSTAEKYLADDVLMSGLNQDEQEILKQNHAENDADVKRIEEIIKKIADPLNNDNLKTQLEKLIKEAKTAFDISEMQVKECNRALGLLDRDKSLQDLIYNKPTKGGSALGGDAAVAKAEMAKLTKYADLKIYRYGKDGQPSQFPIMKLKLNLCKAVVDDNELKNLLTTLFFIGVRGSGGKKDFSPQQAKEKLESILGYKIDDAIKARERVVAEEAARRAAARAAGSGAGIEEPEATVAASGAVAPDVEAAAEGAFAPRGNVQQRLASIIEQLNRAQRDNQAQAELRAQAEERARVAEEGKVKAEAKLREAEAEAKRLAEQAAGSGALPQKSGAGKKHRGRI